MHNKATNIDFLCCVLQLSKYLFLSMQEQRELEREMVVNHQSRIGDAATMMKLKRQLKKYKALLEDTQEQLEHESQMRGTSAVIRSLKNQIKELQTSETAALRSYKRLQGDTEELQIQYDKVIMAKSEVCVCVCVCVCVLLCILL